MRSDLHRSLEEAFATHRPSLWRLAYRVTGTTADADEVVQDTFVRALEAPPSDTGRAWRPWLVRVAVNLARDRLRARKRRSYDGPWLPALVDTPEDSVPPSDARYSELESVSVAFLLALEALTPTQRAALVLRDVLDYSVRETAEALATSEANVKTLHLRARRALSGYDETRTTDRTREHEAMRGALERFLSGLLAQDAEAMAAVLTADARVVNDANAEFRAARLVVSGADRVVRLMLGLQRFFPTEVRVAWRIINGEPALLVEGDAAAERLASRYVVRGEVDATGKLREIQVVLASEKLRRVAPISD